MFSNRRRRNVSPFWIFGLIYYAYSLLFPLLRFSAVLIGLGIASGVAAGFAAIVKEKIVQAEETFKDRKDNRPEVPSEAEPAPVQSAPKQEAEEMKYSPAVRSVISDGRLALSEMNRLYSSIRNEAVRSRIRELISVSEKIIQDAKEDESDVPQIRKFLDFYLPTTLKLLNTYDRMDAVDIDGDTIGRTKQNIEEMLDTTIAAYKKQLDALFDNQAMDIDAEIRSMKNLLEREGLSDKNPLDWNSFMAQYDKEEKEKGTTQNG